MKPTMQAIDLLTQRSSTPSRLLQEPAPTDAELQQLLEIAVRVPDHGALVPFRFIRIAGERRAALGAQCEAVLLQDHPDADEAKRNKERGRFTRSPLCVAVIGTYTPGKIPQIEQTLSAGCAAMNLLHAAFAHGFGAQWLTGWPAYHPAIHQALSLNSTESIVAFIYLGSIGAEIQERRRPCVDDLLTDA